MSGDGAVFRVQGVAWIYNLRFAVSMKVCKAFSTSSKIRCTCRTRALGDGAAGRLMMKTPFIYPSSDIEGPQLFPSVLRVCRHAFIETDRHRERERERQTDRERERESKSERESEYVAFALGPSVPVA